MSEQLMDLARRLFLNSAYDTPQRDAESRWEECRNDPESLERAIQVAQRVRDHVFAAYSIRIRDRVSRYAIPEGTHLLYDSDGDAWYLREGLWTLHPRDEVGNFTVDKLFDEFGPMNTVRSEP